MIIQLYFPIIKSFKHETRDFGIIMAGRTQMRMPFGNGWRRSKDIRICCFLSDLEIVKLYSIF